MILRSKGCIRIGHQEGGEGDEEVGHLVDEVLHADDAELAQALLDQVVGGDGGAVALDLNIKEVS